MPNFDYLELETISQPGAFNQYDIEILVKELEKLPQSSLYVEVGVDRGKSLSVAKIVSDRLQRNFLLYGVDINKTVEIEEWLKTNESVLFFHGDSVDIANNSISKTGKPIDLLFIDGDHSYEGCKRDIDAWYPHMSATGVLLFHDYDITSPGVIKAVDEFAMNNEKKVEFFNKEKNTSVAKIQL